MNYFGSICRRSCPRLSRFLSQRRYKMSEAGAAATFKEVSIPVAWGAIRGKAWGDERGQPVLAIHGWLDNAASFDNLAHLLPNSLYIVCIDLPGHGQSSHRPLGTSYHFIDYVKDIKTVIDTLGWEKFSLVGHSLGGSICSWFAGALPDRLQSLVVIESLGVFSRPVDDLPRLMGEALNTPQLPPDTRVYSTFDAAVERLHQGHNIVSMDEDFPLECSRILAERGTTKVDDGYRFSRDLRVKEPSLLKSTNDMNKAFLKSIKCPMLLIFAEKTFIQADFLNKRLEWLPEEQFKLVKVPGGHHTHMYNHKTLAPLLQSFLLSNSIPQSFEVLARL